MQGKWSSEWSTTQGFRGLGCLPREARPLIRAVKKSESLATKHHKPETSTGHLKKMYDQILDAIRRGNITNGDISKATGIPLEKCGYLLRQMRDEGILLSLTRGKYTIRPNYWK